MQPHAGRTIEEGSVVRLKGDKYSYDQMKQKYDVYKAAHPAQYQQPTQEQTQNPNMTYQAPAQPKQPAAPIQPQQPAAPQQPTDNQAQ